jgi:hypothetical protein
MFKITNPMASMHLCIHAIMLSQNIIPTHLFFPSSYLPSFPASLFTPWPPEAAGCCTLFTVLGFSFVRCINSNRIESLRRVVAAGGKEEYEWAVLKL